MSTNDLLIRLVYRKLYSLQKLCFYLKKLLPPSGPFIYAEVLINTLKVLRIYFDKEIETASSPDSIARVAKFCLEWIRSIHDQYFPFLEKAHAKQLPYELEPVFRKLLTQIGFSSNKKFYVYLCSQLRSIYEARFLLNPLSLLLNKLGPDLRRLGIQDHISNIISRQELTQLDFFCFLPFPRQENHNILLHGMIMHELGHLKNFVDEIIEHAITPQIPSQKITTLVERIQKRQPLGIQPNGQLIFDFDPTELKLYVYERCKIILNNWISEIFADIFATRVIGLAYFFSFVDLTLSVYGLEGLSSISDTHPPPIYRMSIIWEYLQKKMGYTESNIDVTAKKMIREWDIFVKQAKYKQYRINRIDDLQEMVFNYIKDNMHNNIQIQQRIIDSVSIQEYDVTKYNSNVPKIVKDYILRGVPPIDEWSEKDKKNYPFDYVSILNAGWTVYLNNLEDFYQLIRAGDLETKLDAQFNFYELLMKAIEGSHILSVVRES